MTHYFLESSALAKLFVRERGTASLIRLIESLDDRQVILSTLAHVEVYSALRRRERAGEIKPADAQLALQSLALECARMTEQTLNPAVVAAACQLMDRHALRALDAVQLASCLVARSLARATDFVFVCADHILLAAAEAEALQTLNPET